MNRAERRRRTRVVKARTRQPWRKLRWPWCLRGAKRGIHEYANCWHRQERARIRDELRVVDVYDPDIDIHSPHHRHNAEWELW